MIEMAETASVTGDSVKQSNQDDAASSPSETSLTTKSTENLIPDASSVINVTMNTILPIKNLIPLNLLLQRHLRSSGKTSNLVISHKSKQHQRAGDHEEPFDPKKVDDYFSDISSGVQSLASTLERVRRLFTFEFEMILVII